MKLLSPEEDAALRYRAWVEHIVRYVVEKSGGKVGYVHVPDTGVNGQNELFRQFFGQRDKAALSVDERWNGGKNTEDFEEPARCRPPTTPNWLTCLQGAPGPEDECCREAVALAVLQGNN